MIEVGFCLRSVQTSLAQSQSLSDNPAAVCLCECVCVFFFTSPFFVWRSYCISAMVLETRSVHLECETACEADSHSWKFDSCVRFERFRLILNMTKLSQSFGGYFNCQEG